MEVIRWIAAFLNNRTIEMISENRTIRKLTSDELPQGDVLSPTLFNIYSSQIHKQINDNQLLQYADDFIIILNAKTAQELKKKK